MDLVDHPDSRYGLRAAAYQQHWRAQAAALDGAAARHHFYMQTIREVLGGHPRAALAALWMSLRENQPRPFDPDELDASGLTAQLPGPVVLATAVFFVGVLTGVVRLLLAGRLRALFFLGLVYSVFALASAVSYWQGTRLMYPVEPLLMVLFGCAFAPRGVLGTSPHMQPT
jgi:hypothetical protein